MPQNRQPEKVEEKSIVVRSLSVRLPSKHIIRTHKHDWHQLIYATRGVVTVETPAGTWVVPSHRAVWIPAKFEHSLKTTGNVWMRTLYFRPDLARHPSTPCCVVDVAPLLRELILESARLGMLLDNVPEHARLAAVLFDQIVHRNETELKIIFPSDARARRVVEKVRENLSTVQPISLLARGCGASPRTIERLFRQETGLTFGRWVQLVKTLHALERIAAGDSVAAAGLAVGYDNTSAFIAMFRRVLGTTPGKYFQHSRPLPTSDRSKG